MPNEFSQIEDDFSFLDDWEDRYRYVIELGRELEPLPEEERTDDNKVRGCASQVWLSKQIEGDGENPRLHYHGDSDALIVRGLIAILLSLLSGRGAREIAQADPEAAFAKLGLREHLTSQRSNGLTAMVRRIQADAQAALLESAGA